MLTIYVIPHTLEIIILSGDFVARMIHYIIEIYDFTPYSRTYNALPDEYFCLEDTGHLESAFSHDKFPSYLVYTQSQSTVLKTAPHRCTMLSTLSHFA